jgi:hypothetical protein
MWLYKHIIWGFVTDIDIIISAGIGYRKIGTLMHISGNAKW